MLEAASKQDRAPDTVYSLPFPVIIAPEALTPPNPAEVQVELAEVTEVTEVEEGAEPAKKKAVVPPVYKWHAVVPLVKSEQQEPPEQAAPAAAASEASSTDPSRRIDSATPAMSRLVSRWPA